MGIPIGEHGDKGVQGGQALVLPAGDGFQFVLPVIGFGEAAGHGGRKAEK